MTPETSAPYLVWEAVYSTRSRLNQPFHLSTKFPRGNSAIAPKMSKTVRVHTATLRVRGLSYTVELRFEDEENTALTTTAAAVPLLASEIPGDPEVPTDPEHPVRAESPEVSPAVPPASTQPSATGPRGISRPTQEKSVL